MYNWKPLYLDTFLAELPKSINDNFQTTENYLNIFYDPSRGIIIAPIETTGNIRGGRVEAPTGVFDTLVVKQQFTNLYENTTTIDSDWYNTWAATDTSTRDASTWEIPGYRYVDVVSPYYKVVNQDLYGFKTTQLGQEFQLILQEPSTASPYVILIDPSSGFGTEGSITLEVLPADASFFWAKLIAVDYDASSGTTWKVKEFGGTFTYEIN